MVNLQERFEEKRLHHFKVNNMSNSEWDAFKKDCVENFGDNYAKKIMHDHNFRMRSKEREELLLLTDNLNKEYVELCEQIDDIYAQLDDLKSTVRKLEDENKNPPPKMIKTMGGLREL